MTTLRIFATMGVRRQWPRTAPSRATGAVLAVLLIAVSVGPVPAEASPSGFSLSSPVIPVTVMRLASLPSEPWHAGHRGIDLSSSVGDPVSAPAAGVVSFVGFVVDRAVVSLRHDGGLVTSLEPVDSTLTAGDIVARGQTVGTVAANPDHCAPRTCVHWGLRLNGVYVDPLDYLEGYGPIRLLSQSSG